MPCATNGAEAQADGAGTEAALWLWVAAGRVERTRTPVTQPWLTEKQIALQQITHTQVMLLGRGAMARDRTLHAHDDEVPIKPRR